MKRPKELPLIGKGGEHAVYDLGDGRVLKVPIAESREAVLSWLRCNAPVFPDMQWHLGRFLPETQYHEALPHEEGMPEKFADEPGIIQQMINGKVLATIDQKNAEADPGVMKELVGMMEAVLTLYEEKGIVVDWLGPKAEGNRHMRISPLASSNILVTEDDEGAPKIKLIDTNSVNDEIVPLNGNDSRPKFRKITFLDMLFLFLSSLGSEPAKPDSSPRCALALCARMKKSLRGIFSIARLKIVRFLYEIYYETYFRWMLKRYQKAEAKRRLRK